MASSMTFTTTTKAKPSVSGLKAAVRSDSEKALPNHPPPYTAGERLQLTDGEAERFYRMTGGISPTSTDPDVVFKALYGTDNPDDVYRKRQGVD